MSASAVESPRRSPRSRAVEEHARRKGEAVTDQMRQYAPYPQALEDAVSEFRYMDGWHFRLDDIERDFEPDDHDRMHGIAGGLTFIILVPCFDSYHPDQYRPVTHYHPVPAATFNRGAWERWIVDMLLRTITHEACEHPRFVIEGDFTTRGGEHSGEHVRRPFAPTHGPGDDPYVIHEYASDEQRRTSFRGTLNP